MSSLGTRPFVHDPMGAPIFERIHASADRVMARANALLTWNRVHRYPLFGLAGLLLFYGIATATGTLPFDAFGNPLAVDLTAHVTGGQIAASGNIQRLYDFAYQWQVQQQILGGGHPKFIDLYLSPPFVAYLYAPFASLPYLASAAIWTLLTIALLVVSFRLLWPVVPGLHRFGFWFVLVLFFSSWPVLELILDGQDSAITLLLLILGLRLLLARCDTLAGVVLGMGAFKPQLFLLIPVLLICQRRWRGLATMGVTALGLAALSAALLGPAGTRSYVEMFTSGAYGSAIVSDPGWKMQSFVALARALFPGPIQFLVIPSTAAIVGLFVALFVRAALRPARTERAFLLLFALAVTVGGIVNPHFFLYDCTVLVLPFLIAFDDAPSRPIVRLSLAAAYAISWTVPLRHVLFGNTPWPVSLLDAPWTVVPVMALAFFLGKHLLKSQEGPEGVPENGGSAIVVPLKTHHLLPPAFALPAATTFTIGPSPRSTSRLRYRQSGSNAQSPG